MFGAVVSCIDGLSMMVPPNGAPSGLGRIGCGVGAVVDAARISDSYEEHRPAMRVVGVDDRLRHGDGPAPTDVVRDGEDPLGLMRKSALLLSMRGMEIGEGRRYDACGVSMPVRSECASIAVGVVIIVVVGVVWPARDELGSLAEESWHSDGCSWPPFITIGVLTSDSRFTGV